MVDHSYEPNFSTFHPFFLTGTELQGCDGIKIEEHLPMAVKGVMTGLALTSMSAALFVGYNIFVNEKLSIHPSKLIGYMCYCEAISCFNALIWIVNPMEYICYFGLHYLYNWSTFTM